MKSPSRKTLAKLKAQLAARKRLRLRLDDDGVRKPVTLPRVSIQQSVADR